MSDLAQILGVGGGGNAPAGPKAIAGAVVNASTKKNADHKAIQKLTGRSREVMGLLGPAASAEDAAAAAALMTAPLPPAVPGGFAPGTKKSAILASPNEPGSVKVGNRWIKIQTPARKWAWAPFSSSSRSDGCLFHHWVRAGVEYPDHPFARFDIHLDPVAYTLEEYQKYLQSDSWTKSETDKLMDLARQLELRWPVIYDRWIELFELDGQSGEGNDPPKTQRNIEDLQFRFYQVAALLNQARIAHEAASEAHMLNSASPDPNDPDQKAATDHLLYETAAARHLATMDPSHQPLITNVGTGTSNKIFDLKYEKERRAYMEAQWNRTKEEEMEEAALRKELKQIEAQLRKIKKSGAHILEARKLGVATGGTGVTTMGGGSAASSRNPSRSVSPLPPPGGASALGSSGSAAAGGEPPAAAALDSAFASTAPVPVPGIPYLQSGRLVEPATGGTAGLNKTLLSRMEAVLHELKVPPQLLPTQRNCDLYDAVRKDIITLLILQKNVLQKEGLLQKKRMGIDKLLGSAAAAVGSPIKPIVTEETVMGIMPPPSPAPSPAQASKQKAASKASGKPGAGGKKGGGKGGGGKKANAAAAAADGTEDSKVSADKKEGGKGGKQAVNKTAGAGGKQAGKGAAVAAGKGGKKAAPKRKRKADANSKSPVPTNAAAAAGGATSAAEVPKPSAKKRKKSTATAATNPPAAAPAPAPSPTQKK